MRVAQLELDGVGPFVDATFRFSAPSPGQRGELFFFEGPNGSGKTTLLMAIAMCLGPWADSAMGGWGESFPALLAPPFLWSKRLLHAKSRVRLVIEEGQGRLTLWHDRQHTTLEVSQEPLPSGLAPYHRARRGEEAELSWSAYAFSGHQPTPVVDVAGPAPFTKAPLHRALLFGHDAPPPLGQLLVNMDYQRTRALAYANDPKHAPEREHLLASAAASDAALSRVQRALSRVLDREVLLQFDLATPGPRLLFDGKIVPLELLGEGLRSTVAWLSDLIVQLELTPWARRDVSPFDQHFWLLLDEIEQSLHPRLQMRIFPALRELFPNACIYAATHSPFVIASMGEGQVFSLEPKATTRQVQGEQRSQPLVSGRTLERVVSEVFETPNGFLEPELCGLLEEHERLVQVLRRSQAIDWEHFFRLRRQLMGLTDEVRTVVAMREARVRDKIDQRLSGAAS